MNLSCSVKTKKSDVNRVTKLRQSNQRNYNQIKTKQNLTLNLSKAESMEFLENSWKIINIMKKNWWYKIKIETFHNQSTTPLTKLMIHDKKLKLFEANKNPDEKN